MTMYYLGPHQSPLYKSTDLSKVLKVQEYYSLAFPDKQFPITTKPAYNNWKRRQRA